MVKPIGHIFSIEWRSIPLTGTATIYPGRPGVYSGPPEKCYPDEPAEIEITDLFMANVDVMGMLQVESIAEEISTLVEETFEPEQDGPEYEPSDMTDVEADADTLRSAGYGTDEDYGVF